VYSKKGSIKGVDLMISNLTQPEISAVVKALNNAGATDEDRRIFFDPKLCNPRVESWIKAIRAGKITLTSAVEKKILPAFEDRCTD
jgi:hypothetical protein